MLKYKIAILGKAKSGKNTAANYFREILYINSQETKIIGLADAIKKAAQEIFPEIPHEFLFGDSELRESLVPGYNFTVRKVLTDIGKLGRSYDPNRWINIVDLKLKFANENNYQLFIVPDVRFINELKYFQQNGFLCLRIKRDDHTSLNDISETEQDNIPDTEFDYIIDNNHDKNHLYEQIITITENNI